MKSAYKIRKAKPDDITACRAICIQTANGYDITKKRDRKLIVRSFCDPYVLHFTDTCFVAVDANDVPFGYVICAPDFDAYIRIRLKHYNNVFTRRSASAYLTREKQLLAAAYPAHLHINILQGGQKSGTGGALMRALFEELRARGVPGVHLGVGGDNENAIGFYKHLGFSEIGKASWGIYLGLRL